MGRDMALIITGVIAIIVIAILWRGGATTVGLANAITGGVNQFANTAIYAVPQSTPGQYGVG